jgi:CheY-like chemotaxis protein
MPDIIELSPTTLDPAFVEQIQQVLDHLYDFPYLQRHPLARQAQDGNELSSDIAGQRLRRELVTAIESLNPGPSVGFRSTVARSYGMLQLHYVEGLTVLESARKLCISPRQAHRELRRGEESVAELMWAQMRPAAAHPEEEEQGVSVQAEIARLGNQVHATDVCALLVHAKKTVEKLAASVSVSLNLYLPPYPVLVSAEPIAAQQLIVSMLSHMVRQARPGDLEIDLRISENGVRLTAAYAEQPALDGNRDLSPVVGQLAAQLGWQIVARERTGESAPEDVDCPEYIICMPGLHHTVLVIDDNEGLIALVERYLSTQICRVIKAGNGPDGLQLAQDLTPDAIILDIMLPKIDGWEVLQRLRADARTMNIPVIVCSVMNEPELAESLGASLVLPKPVSRDTLISALHKVGVF